MEGTQHKVLSMRGIHKEFPGVHALKGVDMDLYKGEVLALLGENGAGKSTLIKMLGGAHQPTTGKILVDGEEIVISNPLIGQQLGIGIIYQEFNLVPYLSARENIFLGRELVKRGLIRKKEEQRKTQELFDRLGVAINTETICSRLSIAEQQLVEIAKALSQEANILVMDEPTATLTPQEVKSLFRIIQELKTAGISIIYISHRLDEIFEVADRTMVLRDGAHISTMPTSELDRQSLIEMMVGRKVENEFPPRQSNRGEEVFRAEHLSLPPMVNEVSFSLHAGEILGITGLVGSGRTETVRIIAGADLPAKGRIFKNGKELRLKSPREAIQAGICLLTEDRKGQGLVLMHNLKENFGLPNLDQFSRRNFLQSRQERTAFHGYVDKLMIKIANEEQAAGKLSGGNQQKLVLAKWLQRNCDIIIFDEPTRGIDVGAKYEIYVLMQELAKEGKAIIMVSSELPEVLGISDRILVMHEGRVSGEIKNVEEATQAEIMELAVR